MKNRFILKIPPPLLAFLAFLGQLLTADFHLNTFYPTLSQWVIAVFLLLASAVVSLWSIILMKNAQTPLSPHCPEKTQCLITHGIFAYTRNPMYLSLLLGLLATTVLLGNFLGLLWVVLFVWAVTTIQIKPEEQILKRYFAEYHDYIQRVRRWL